MIEQLIENIDHYLRELTGMLPNLLLWYKRGKYENSNLRKQTS